MVNVKFAHGRTEWHILDTKYQDCGCSVVLVTPGSLANWKLANRRPCELISTIFIDISA